MCLPLKDVSSSPLLPNNDFYDRNRVLINFVTGNFRVQSLLYSLVH